MPLVINRTSEADVGTFFGTEFIRGLVQYLGMDPDTPSEDMPISVNDLLEEAVSVTETEQWRNIMKLSVQLSLPVEAFCESDRLVFLPLGVADDVTIAYKSLTDTDEEFTDFSQYGGEPIRLYSKNWDTLVSDCADEPYPITVSYSPGYGSLGHVPKSTIRALKLLVAYHFEYRGADVPIPKAYFHNCFLAWLNNERANRYIVDDWKVSPR